ncbi:Cysteine/O-acetylserine efflux protein [Serratia fonticola]|nr:Cysteine/O-acetylserine efflux protein [Serratia fonticola]
MIAMILKAQQGNFLQYSPVVTRHAGTCNFLLQVLTMTLYLSMAAFALASSITPGPVNIVALSCGAQFGFTTSLRHVTGATLGFTLLLVSVGLGMHEVLTLWPGLTTVILWGGVAFLLYMAYQLAADDGKLSQGNRQQTPSYWYGALLQWLNPKAWLASVASMGAFVGDGEMHLLWQFAALYFVICYLSIACWAYAGAMLSGLLQRAHNLRRFNRLMALLLAFSACYLLAEGI